jgi:hypothetical protein
VVKNWFSGFGNAAWQSLLGGGLGSDWSDVVSFWHARFAATPPLGLKSGVAATSGITPHEGSESTASVQAQPESSGTPESAGEPTAFAPAAAFNALADSHDRFGTIFSYDFSEKAMMNLTGTGPLDRGVWHGALSAGSFEADIAKALGSALAPGHGLFFTPDSGDFAGEAFLVVDANGVAGFQAGEDVVYHLMPVYLNWGNIQATTPLDQLLPAPHVG